MRPSNGRRSDQRTGLTGRGPIQLHLESFRGLERWQYPGQGPDQHGLAGTGDPTSASDAHRRRLSRPSDFYAWQQLPMPVRSQRGRTIAERACSLEAAQGANSTTNQPTSQEFTVLLRSMVICVLLDRSMVTEQTPMMSSAA